MKFDDINLPDDKSAPKLDLDFGLDSGAADDGKKSSGFSFGGGWGGGWGGAAEKNTNSWGFGGADTAAAVVVEEVVSPVAETSSWGFGALGGSKKKKGAAGKSGFDFDFQDTPEGDANASAGADLASPSVEEVPAVDDAWSGFAAAGYVSRDCTAMTC